ncbi:MAG: phage minor head protein [bacterium]
MVQSLAAFEAALGAGEVVSADAIAAAAFNLEVEIAALERTIRPYLAHSAGRAITAMTRDYGIGADVTIDTEFIRDLLQAQESRFARDVTQTSVRGIRDQIAEGIANGEAYYQLRDRILSYYEGQAQWRAGLAAQFESGTAYESIREVLALRQGMSHKRWETMRDERVEVICQHNEAAGGIPIAEPFPSGDMRPLAHPLCRCWCTYSAE